MCRYSYHEVDCYVAFSPQIQNVTRAYKNHNQSLNNCNQQRIYCRIKLFNILLLQNTYTTVEHCLVECSHVEVETLVDHGSQPRLRRVQVAVGAIRVDLESISTTKLFHRRVLKKLDHLSFSERCFFSKMD